MMSISIFILPILFILSLRNKRLLSFLSYIIFVILNIYFYFKNTPTSLLYGDLYVEMLAFCGLSLLSVGTGIVCFINRREKLLMYYATFYVLAPLLMSTTNILVYFFSSEVLFNLSLLSQEENRRSFDSLKRLLKSDLFSVLFFMSCAVVIFYSGNSFTIESLKNDNSEVQLVSMTLFSLYVFIKLGLLASGTSIIENLRVKNLWLYILFHFYCIAPFVYKSTIILQSFKSGSGNDIGLNGLAILLSLIYLSALIQSLVKFKYVKNLNEQANVLINITYINYLIILPFIAITDASVDTIVTAIFSNTVVLISTAVLAKHLEASRSGEDLNGAVYKNASLALLYMAVLYNVMGLPFGVSYNTLFLILQSSNSLNTATWITLFITFTFLLKFFYLRSLFSSLIRVKEKFDLAKKPVSTNNKRKFVEIISLMILVYTSFIYSLP